MFIICWVNDISSCKLPSLTKNSSQHFLVEVAKCISCALFMYIVPYSTDARVYFARCLDTTCRGTYFPFQKIAFFVSENLQSHFNMVEKWKFRFPREIVHIKYWKCHLHRDVCYKYIRGSAEELHGNIFILVCDIL